MRLVHATLLTAILAAVVAACGMAGMPSTVPSSPAPSDPGPAIDTDALLAVAAANAGKTVRVKGFLLIVGDEARLCSIVLESYPPQCGGGNVRITGEIPADVATGLDRTTEPGLAPATWGWVEVTGTFNASGADGTPTVQISEIRLDAP